MQSVGKHQQSGSRNLMSSLLWRTNDEKAQKNGSHCNIYWVRKQPLNQDGSEKSNKWIGSHKYVGDWKDNKKNGFGIQHYSNGDKYEGGWSNSKRHGQGTYWVSDAKNKLRRQYTGDWQNGEKKGRGTMFYKTGDRYDGMWMQNLPHGQGRMIFSNGDVYEGMWFMGKRSGYGVLTKRIGDHFEGHWVNDKRQGQGSYFFSQKNKIFVGEWVNDAPKTGVYSEVQDPTSVKIDRQKHFTDPYILPSFEEIGLENPTAVLEQSIQKVRKNRTLYRARFIPLDQLYTKPELMELEKQFGVAVSQKDVISVLSMQAILINMGITVDKNQLQGYLINVRASYVEDEIDFQLFVRVVALLLELRSLNKGELIEEVQDEEKEEQSKWFNQEQNQ